MVDKKSPLNDSSAIADKLIEAIERDSSITSSDSLSPKALKDNLPAVCHTVVQAIAKHNVDYLAIAEGNKGYTHGNTRSAQNFAPEEITREFFLLKKIVLEQLNTQLLNSSPSEIVDTIGLVDLIINKVMENCFHTYAVARKQQIEALHQQIFFTNQEIRRLIADHQDTLDYLAHEIKNPLTSIIGYSDLYLRQQAKYDSASDNLKHIQQVLQQGRNALRIVNDSVEIADYQQGNFKLKVRQIEICSLLDNIVRSLKNDIESKNIGVVAACSPENLIVTTDYLRLQQIVTNLLTNAIRYTRAGTIEVSCYRVDKQILEIRVADTGIGIPLEHRDRIFEPYFRSDVSQLEVPEGVGLGLAIVAQLVSILGGKIRLDSEVNVGSTFIVQIPVTIRDVD